MITNADGLFAAALPCRDEDPELFFPISGPGTERYEAAVEEACAVCASCPARAECLAYVLKIESPTSPHGIWGGTTPEQRSTLRRKLRRAAEQAALPPLPIAALGAGAPDHLVTGRVVDEYETAGSVA